MAYVLQIPDTIVVNGENHLNGHIRMGSDSFSCTIGIQMYDTVRAEVVRGPELILVMTPFGPKAADMKKITISNLVERAKEWRNRMIIELQMENVLQDLIATIKAELGI